MKATGIYLPAGADYHTAERKNIAARFIDWCAGQESRRMLWVGSSLAVHGCVLTPITMSAVILSGINPVLLALTAVSIMLTLVTNLAAMPMKYAIPIFCTSLLINTGIIVSCIVAGMHPAAYF